MTIRIILAAFAITMSSTAILHAAPQATPPLMMATPQDDLVRVALDTSAGRIVIALDAKRAPVTSANFLKYVTSGKFDGETFYRAMPYGQGGLIQGGIRSDGRKLTPAIAHEASATTGIKHVAGTISMANAGPGTARSDFFILTTDVPAFDASFAAFGRVVEGMDVVKKILAAPVSVTKGEGAMKGQMLEPGITIVKAALVTP